MADTKISALVSKAAPGASDLLVIVDVSDTTMAASGTDKQATVSQVLSAGTVSAVSKTANYTLTASDSVVFGDVSGGAFTLTLPTASGVSGKKYTVKRVDASANSNVLTVGTTSSQTVDGSTTLTLDLDRHWVTVISDGANWQIVDLGPGVRTRFRQTADQTITSTSETSLFGTGAGSLTFPAGFWTVGKTVRVTCLGEWTTTATPGTYRLRLKLGTTVLFDSTALSPAASATNAIYRFAFVLTCRSTGASGTVQALQDGAVTESTTSSARYPVPGTATAAATVDTTASQTLDLTTLFSVSTGTMTNKLGIVESLN